MSTWRCSRDYFGRAQADGSLRVVNERTGDHALLNRSARLFVECVAAGTALDEAVQRFASAFQVDPARLEAELGQLARELERLGIIEREPRTGE